MNPYPKVVYVEDDELSRMVLQLVLQDGMNLEDVLILPNSQNFKEKMRSLAFVPDIFLLDIHMDPIDGFEMLSILRSISTFKSIPIVALTASVMNEEVDLLRQAGFNGVIGKPIDEVNFPDLLLRLINGESVWTI